MPAREICLKWETSCFMRDFPPPRICNLDFLEVKISRPLTFSSRRVTVVIYQAMKTPSKLNLRLKA